MRTHQGLGTKTRVERERKPSSRAARRARGDRPCRWRTGGDTTYLLLHEAEGRATITMIQFEQVTAGSKGCAGNVERRIAIVALAMEPTGHVQ